MQILEITSSVPAYYCVYCSKPDGSFMVTHFDGKCPHLKDYITHEVETMQVTEIYKPLDPGIETVVNLLRSHGIDTFSSCEGGEGHAFAMPTIRVNPEPIWGITEHKIAQVLSEAGYSGYYIKQCHAYQDKPWPWEDQKQHFVEIEFWSSPIERKTMIDLTQIWLLIVIFTLFTFGMLFITIGLRAEESGDDSTKADQND